MQQARARATSAAAAPRSLLKECLEAARRGWLVFFFLLVGALSVPAAIDSRQRFSAARALLRSIASAIFLACRACCHFCCIVETKYEKDGLFREFLRRQCSAPPPKKNCREKPKTHDDDLFFFPPPRHHQPLSFGGRGRRDSLWRRRPAHRPHGPRPPSLRRSGGRLPSGARGRVDRRRRKQHQQREALPHALLCQPLVAVGLCLGLGRGDAPLVAAAPEATSAPAATAAPAVVAGRLAAAAPARAAAAGDDAGLGVAGLKLSHVCLVDAAVPP